MVKKAVPKAQQNQDLAKEKDSLLNEAVALYLAEKAKKGGMGARKIADMLQEQHFEQYEGSFETDGTGDEEEEAAE